MKLTSLKAKLVLALGLCSLVGTASAVDYKIVTASERGTYIQIGRDLAKLVAPEAGFNLESVPSAGAAENMKRLRYEPAVKFALVQSDVVQAYMDASTANAEARGLVRNLRLIAPLYNEEIYFIARKDSPINFVHEIKDQKISLGQLGSGGALTVSTLYRQIFGRQIPQENAQFMSNDEGLSKLVNEQSVDVVTFVVGQPAKILADMKSGSKDLIKLLKFDPKHPSSKEVLKSYFPATVRATSYPNLLTEDVPSVSVKAFLVTYNFDQPQTRQHLTAFGKSFCENFSKLQAEGHPKWKEVSLELTAPGEGWVYYPATTNAIKSCLAAQSKPVVPKGPSCTVHDKTLGLC